MKILKRQKNIQVNKIYIFINLNILALIKIVYIKLFKKNVILYIYKTNSQKFIKLLRIINIKFYFFNPSYTHTKNNYNVNIFWNSEYEDSHKVFQDFFNLYKLKNKNLNLYDSEFSLFLKKISTSVNKNSKFLNIVFWIYIINSISIIFKTDDDKKNYNKFYLIVDSKLFRDQYIKLANKKNINLLSLPNINNFLFWSQNFIINLKLLIKFFLNFNQHKSLNLPNYDLVVDNAVEIINQNYIIDSNIIPFKKVLYFSYYNRNDLPKIIQKDISYFEFNHFKSFFLTTPNLSLIIKTFFSRNFTNLFVQLTYLNYLYKIRSFFNFFKKIKAKVYLTSHKFLEHPILATAAINDLGGISCIMQSSYSEKVSSSAAIYSDIYFSFSNNNYQYEIQSGSKFKYLVSVGYFKDYLFKKYKDESNIIREKFSKKGANFIVSYFDNGFDLNDDYGYDVNSLMEEYKFLLEKLLEHKWFGLIFKSKTPKHINRLLTKEFPDLYSKCIKSQRLLFEIDTQTHHTSKNTTLNPSQFASASDVCIHNSLAAGTAGIEAILTETPTMFLDKIGCNSFLKNTKNSENIIFNDIKILWNKLVLTYRNNDMSSIKFDNETLYKLDNFRDGKSRHRINYFIKHLIENLKKYNNKTIAIEHAVQEYKNKWGNDKIIKF